jgi:putative membrane protein
VDPAIRVDARPDDRERWTTMYGMTDILRESGVLATLLLQRGDGPLDELWEPEVLFLIVFLGALVAVVVWLVVRVFPKVRRDEQLGEPRDSAEEILRERFARGEITAEEYQRSIEILRGATAREVPDDAREDG